MVRKVEGTRAAHGPGSGADTTAVWGGQAGRQTNGSRTK